MKKLSTIIALILLAAALMSFNACSEPEANAGNSASHISGETDSNEEQLPKGEVYDTGKFSVAVPDGWTAVKVPDIFDETKVDENSVYLVNADSVDDIDDIIFSSDILYITVYYTRPDGFFFEPSRDYYSDIEDVNVTVNGEEWTGFSGKLVGPTLLIWNERADGSVVQANISNYSDGVLESHDVQTILGSVH